MNNSLKTIVVLSITSDIAQYLARQYLNRGWRVIGTYRTKNHVKDLIKMKGCVLFHCDLSKMKSVEKFTNEFKAIKAPWDVFISGVGDLLPAQPFFEASFDDWSRSVHVNSIEQLRVLHALYPLRRREKVARVVLFAGGGMNNAVVNLSAYTISKIMLTKMCEFIDAENKDLSILIVGPGFTKTKIHDQILKGKPVARAKFIDTQKDLKSKEGTSLKDIFECIDWLIHEKKENVSGRNFSVAFDPWQKDMRAKLLKALKSDEEMYKLRRRCG